MTFNEHFVGEVVPISWTVEVRGEQLQVRNGWVFSAKIGDVEIDDSDFSFTENPLTIMYDLTTDTGFEAGVNYKIQIKGVDGDIIYSDIDILKLKKRYV